MATQAASSTEARPRDVRPHRQLGLLTWIAWSAALFWAVVISIVVVVWVVPILFTLGTDLPSPRNLNSNTLRRGEIVIHAIAGTIALLIGPWQMLAPIRAARPGLHRWLGRAYVVVAIASGAASLALHAKLESYGAGHVLMVMGALWIAATVLGLAAVLRGDIVAHWSWMVRSYSLAWGAVSIRLFDQLLKFFEVPFAYKYPAIIWLALLTNVVLAEVLVRRTRMWF